ncbi:hypothetical protein Tco_0829855 [Tanacetum coccineum]
MKDIFDSTKSDLSATWKQNELLKDQLLEARLKNYIECCVLLSHECVDNNMQDEIEKVQRDSIETQEVMQICINILENDVQRVQTLIIERDNVKTEYKKLFDLIKKTRAQTQGEINELIKNIKQKTYAYADVRAQNQDLLMTISELKARLKNVENGKSVNTKFDKANVSKKLLCVTPLNKQDFQKKIVVPKIEEKHVLSKIVTLQTLPNKQQTVGTNKNVIAHGMHKVGTREVTNTNKAKSVLSSTGLNATSSVRKASNRNSSFKNSVVSNTKNSSEKVEVSDRINKKQDVALNTIVTNDKIKNALIAKNVLCVSCAKNVLIPCHDNCLAKYKLNVRLKVRRALFTTSRTVKSMFKGTSPVVSKTRFSVKTVQSTSLDTTHVVSKDKIDTVTTLSDKNKVVQIVLWIVDSGCLKHMTGDRSLLKNFIENDHFATMGTVHFGNDHFTIITGYDDYVQGNIMICHVYYVKGRGHNLFSVGQLCDGDLKVAFRSKTFYVQNLEGDDLLTGDRESNLYTISNPYMDASSPICLISKASLIKSWLWHRRLSHP